MSPKILFYLADTAVYPLSVVLLFVSLKGNVENAGPVIFRIIVTMWAALLVASLVVARCWLGNALHAVPPLLMTFFIAYVYVAWPQWRNAFIPEPFDEKWYEEGIARRTGKRVAGMEHGVIRYYAGDGRLVRSETWKHGEQEGPFRGYHDNGRLAERGVMKHVETEDGDSKLCRTGKWRFYREDGASDDVRTYEKGCAVSSRNYSFYRRMQPDGRGRYYRFADGLPFTGQLEMTGIVGDYAFPAFYTARFADGYLEGPWHEYYPWSGFPLAAEGFAAEGYLDSTYRVYHPNGQLGTAAFYRLGELEGEYIAYYPDSLASRPHGQARYRCNYAAGKRHGTARWWRKDGTLDTETEYRDGVRDGICREYDEQGRLWSVTPYRNGRREGLAVRYGGDGSRTETEYRDDEEVCERRYAPDEASPGKRNPGDDAS